MIYILIALSVFLLDWNIKNYIERHFNIGEKKTLFGGVITLGKQYNKGFSFNILKDKTEYVKKITAFVFGILVLMFIFILPRKSKALKKIGLSLCVGGAASNVADRFKRGYVIDYFSLNIKPIKNIVFNLADIFIMLGCVMTFIASLIQHKGSIPAMDNTVLPEIED